MKFGHEESTTCRSIVALTLGAIALRLLLFVGRGDYVAFDEGWYLLLGESLWSGRGYRLSGLRHVTLSPLFPILAGGLDRIIGNPVWAGRIVAAVTSGLLVLPCWSIFRRLTDRRTAILACGIVAVMPSLAPFVAPEWVGWDLWVGAEPVYHLFLFTGLAFVLRGASGGKVWDWMAGGASFALAYLARPEAVVVVGLLGPCLVGLAVARRRKRELFVGLATLSIAFAVVALPYWIYLHDATGRWSLTGRVVEVGVSSKAERGRRRSSDVIERMLWEGRHGEYVRTLFALHPSGTRMASTYWGVPDTTGAPRVTPPASGADLLAVGTDPTEHPGDGGIVVSDGAGEVSKDQAKADTVAPVDSGRPGRGRIALYAGALGRVAPRLLWPLVVVGLLARRRRSRGAELVFAAPLVGAAAMIALVVAVDPRTQLFVAPLAAIYAARGIRAVGVLVDRRIPRSGLRRGFLGAVLASTAVGGMILEDARRAYLSVTTETTHQFLASAYRRAGEALSRIVPPGQSIMSWHPAVALYADRDWRVLPMAAFPEVIRYAQAIGTEYIVFSLFYPSPIPVEEMPRNYLAIRLPKSASVGSAWRIELLEISDDFAFGRLIVD